MSGGVGVSGGVESGAIVFESGSHSIRAGYSGDDTPRIIAPSNYSIQNPSEFIFGDELLTKSIHHIHDIHQLHQLRSLPDSSQDIPSSCQSILASMLSKSITKLTGNTSKTRPVLMIEPSMSYSKSERYAITESVFESSGIAAFFLLKSSVAAAFASARATGLVVDLGHSAAVVTAVADGYALEKSTKINTLLSAQQFSKYAAKLILDSKLKASGASALEPSAAASSPPSGSPGRVKRMRMYSSNIDERYQLSENVGGESEDAKRKSVEEEEARVLQENLMLDERIKSGLVPKEVGMLSESELEMKRNGWFSFYRMKLMEDIKHSVVKVSENKAEKSESEEVIEYELPDGEVVKVSKYDGELVGEKLFGNVGNGGGGIELMCYEVMSGIDVDLRRELSNAVVLCGGGSQMSGLYNRFQKEMAELTPQMYKLRVLAPQMGLNSVEKSSMSWIGGSILSSLGTFQQMWLSKAEYEENGASAIDRRCP
uniref:Actin-related protein 4 n=1 Tax=Timspurckia oligopyrenoides TaxID=708627 RepID=A0A7S0ZB26_9RHOD|mmetsp:Transcript_10785/g.19497  ORF Transcript_10785/g.19497 Transcript_10785/m.19497 type:complete len:485 (+) Transcript_10785:44-1498(+)